MNLKGTFLILLLLPCLAKANECSSILSFKSRSKLLFEEGSINICSNKDSYTLRLKKGENGKVKDIDKKVFDQQMKDLITELSSKNTRSKKTPSPCTEDWSYSIEWKEKKLEGLSCKDELVNLQKVKFFLDYYLD